jgi:hypothetical protein
MPCDPLTLECLLLQVMFVKYKAVQVEDAKRHVSRLAKYDAWALAAPEELQHVLGEALQAAALLHCSCTH